VADSQRFERLPGEPSLAYDAFTKYRNLGPKRSLAAVLRELELERLRQVYNTTGSLPGRTGAQQVGGHERATKRPQRSGVLGRWSKQWDWVERAQAWDRYIDQLRLARDLDQVEEMAKRHTHQSEACQAVIMESIKEYLVERRAKRKPTEDMIREAALLMRRLPAMQDEERKGLSVVVKSGKDADPAGGDFFLVTQIHQPKREQDFDPLELLKQPARESFMAEDATPAEDPNDGPEDGVPRAPKGQR
jgi:hypothetical protein